MLKWPPTIKLAHCYFVTVILILLWIVMKISDMQISVIWPLWKVWSMLQWGPHPQIWKLWVHHQILHVIFEIKSFPPIRFRLWHTILQIFLKPAIFSWLANQHTSSSSPLILKFYHKTIAKIAYPFSLSSPPSTPPITNFHYVNRSRS